MYLQSTLLFGLTASTTAFSLFPRQSNSCPSVWSDVAKDLQADFSGCNGDARGAIRAPFHDCINNGCDGSLILAQEYTRAENAGLSGICTKLGDKAKQFNVGTADMIQFAAAMGIASCQLGPRVRALVGRTDSSVAAPEGSVPSSRDSVDKILGAFGDKGFSAIDVVALMGSHSTARQFFDDPAKAGASLDSTPTVWDVQFYKETTDGTAPYSLASDKKLSNDTRTGGSWSTFAGSQGGWAAAFVDAWNRFSVVGNDEGSLADCSSLIPGGANKREAMRAPVAGRSYIP